MRAPQARQMLYKQPRYIGSFGLVSPCEEISGSAESKAVVEGGEEPGLEFLPRLSVGSILVFAQTSTKYRIANR